MAVSKNAMKKEKKSNRSKLEQVSEDEKILDSQIAIASPVVKKTVAEKIENRKAHPMSILNAKAGIDIIGPVLSIPPYQPQEGESYMNQNQLIHFGQVLNEWKRELMLSVDTTVGHMKEEGTNFADIVDRATQEEEFSLELRTRDRERKLIKKIESALEKIKQGDFGYCEECGVEIGLFRLEVRPTADLCIDCKTIEERRERQLLF